MAAQRTRVAEFFAGIGLMRMGLERVGGYDVVWSNDVEPAKASMYRRHFSEADCFVRGDVRGVLAAELPAVDLATASFPCTDLSLAGGRGGLAGGESSMFWEFHRILAEWAARAVPPRAVLLENVRGFASSRQGADLEDAVEGLNRLGYVCDVLAVDAAWFVPQSRPRVFVVGALEPGERDAGWQPTRVRPRWLCDWAVARPHLKLHAHPLPEPPHAGAALADAVQRLPAESQWWWDAARVERFLASLAPRQADRVHALVVGEAIRWRTAYRRTRGGSATWEVRDDDIAGCLRTPRGGSSKQALVQAGKGALQIRWMTPLEYARLQGAPDYSLAGARDSEAYFGFGDAVAVPAVAWIAESLLSPLLGASARGQTAPARLPSTP